MYRNQNILFALFLGLSAILCLVVATPPSSHHRHPAAPSTIMLKPPPQGSNLPRPTVSPPQTCPVPSEEMLRCIRQWACQYIIRLDLRCLLNLNGNPLLGGILGGGPVTPAVGGTGGSSGGILGGILGL